MSIEVCDPNSIPEYTKKYSQVYNDNNNNVEERSEIKAWRGLNGSCECKQYLNANNTKCRKKKYRQPPPAMSVAVKHCYEKPTIPLNDNTTYQLSYLPVEGERREYMKHNNSLCMGTGKMASNTIQKMSYPGWQNIKPPEPVYPCNHPMMGDGPMQEMTTQKHDYVPKPYSKLDKAVARPGNLCSSNMPLEQNTTQRLSYLPHKSTKAVPKIPENSLCLPTGKIDENTTQKLSYLPWTPQAKEFLPWSQKQKYQPPQIQMDCNTIYKGSYPRNNTDARRKPIIPEHSNQVITGNNNFNGHTVYKESYLPVKAERANAIHQPNQLCMSNAKMDGNTTQKLSYPGWHNMKRPNPILPCNHPLMGEGPLQEMTTQKHDYVPKPYSKPTEIRQDNKLCTSNKPLEQNTTNRLSYQNHGTVKKSQPILPIPALPKTEGAMENHTTQKLSYQPWQYKPKEFLPWSQKLKYQKPDMKLDLNTTYHMSYPVPGDYVEIDDCCSEGCQCMNAGDCLDFPTAAVC